MRRPTTFEVQLRAAFRDVAPDKVTLALRLMQGSYGDAELDTIPAVVALKRRCYSEPNHHHKLMTALDSLLETHGVEYIGVHMYDGPPIEYLNVGDAYTSTVVWYRDLRVRKFKVCGYADAIEWCERRNVRLDDS